jgi:hypothetical protein
MDAESSPKEQSKQVWYRTSVFLAVTIGIPFCIFKYLFGLLAVRAGLGEDKAFLIVFGWTVIIWAAIDLLMNLARIFFNPLSHRPRVEFCLIAQIGRIFKRPFLFLAIDTLLSFTIICFFLWSGWIKSLSLYEAYLWYTAISLNLISISFVYIFSELYLDVDGKSDQQAALKLKIIVTR